MSKRSQRWALVLVFLVAAQIGASLVLRRSYALVSFSDVLQCAALFCAALACVLNISKTSLRSRLFWIFMSLGVGSWLSYQALWTYIELVQKREVPSLFAGDAILFLHFVPMMAAIALQ